MQQSQTRFVRHQGFRDRDTDQQLFHGLMFQPKMIGVLLTVGMVVQKAWLFAALAGVLWWCAMAPAYNVFELLYNRVIADRRGWPRVGPAPEPRRFAQGLATMLAAVIAAALMSDATIVALVAEAVLAAAILGIVFAHFCFGSWAYWRLHRQPSAPAEHRESAIVSAAAPEISPSRDRCSTRICRARSRSCDGRAAGRTVHEPPARNAG
jgi:hypothetical protein